MNEFLSIILFFIFLFSAFQAVILIAIFSVYGGPIKREYLDIIMSKIDEYSLRGEELVAFNTLPYISKLPFIASLFLMWSVDEYGVIWRFSKESKIINKKYLSGKIARLERIKR